MAFSDGGPARLASNARRGRLGILCAALGAALAVFPGTGVAQGTKEAALQQQFEGEVKGQYGDWQYVCKPPPAGAKNEVCALVQSVTAEDRKNVGLTIYFQKFSNGTKVLRVFAPVGVLLPPGIGLKVDGADIGHAPFLRCHTFACYAQVTVDDKLIDRLKTGKTAIFIIFQTEEAGIGIPISLAGFGDGLSALN
jgi:invasion protein IalB